MYDARLFDVESAGPGLDGAAVLAELQATLAAMTPDEMGELVGELQAGLNILSAFQALAVCEAARLGVPQVDGAPDATTWVKARCNVSHHRAGQVITTGEALDGLPAVAAAAVAGRFSDEQLAVVASIADEESDTTHAQHSHLVSVARLRRAARYHRGTSRQDAAAAEEARYLRWRHDASNGLLRFGGALPAADGELLFKTVEALADDHPDPDTPYATRCADALVEAVCGPAAPAAGVAHLHVDFELLAGTGTGHIEGNGPLSPETLQRLTCSHTPVHPASPRGSSGAAHRGDPGLRTRRISARLARYLHARDRTCCFPGCENTRWLQAHHKRHWAHGGPTNRANLALTCHHHKLLHEHGWQLHGDPEDPASLYFTRPDGTIHTTGPPTPGPPTHRPRQPHRPRTKTRRGFPDEFAAQLSAERAWRATRAGPGERRRTPRRKP